MYGKTCDRGSSFDFKVVEGEVGWRAANSVIISNSLSMRSLAITCVRGDLMTVEMLEILVRGTGS